MILPVYLYGHPVLRKMAQPITKEYPKLQELIANMWETMYHSEGVGLAAPQVGLSIKMAVIDKICWCGVVCNQCHIFIQLVFFYCLCNFRFSHFVLHLKQHTIEHTL